MANICNNEIFVTTEDKDNYNHILDYIEYNLEGEIHYFNEPTKNTPGEFEGSFESKWVFPKEKFEVLIDSLCNKEDKSLYIKVFSREDGVYYCEYNVYTVENGWEIY